MYIVIESGTYRSEKLDIIKLGGVGCAGNAMEGDQRFSIIWLWSQHGAQL